MIYEISVKTKKGFLDTHGVHTLADIEGIGISGIKSVDYMPVYRISGEISSDEVKKIAEELLTDKITESYEIKKYKNIEAKQAQKDSVEVWYKKGVTDTVSESVVKAIKDLGIKRQITVKTGKKYCLKGDLNIKKTEKIATGLLANTLIQEYLIK